jgi:hypothetical protein
MNKNIQEDQNVFTTYDLGVSAGLLTKGYKLRSLDKSNRRALFIFEHKKGIEKSANDFFTNDLNVKARSYFDNLKALKSKLYSA